MKKIETKKILRLLYIPFLIFLISFVLNINLVLSKKVYISADGKVVAPRHEKDKKLKDILRAHGIVLNKDDIISADIELPVKPNSRINIIRVKKTTAEIFKEFPFRITWRKVYTSNLRKVELQKGITKTLKDNITQIFYDGKLKDIISNKEISTSKTFYRLILLKNNNEIEKIYDLSKAKRMDMIATAYYPGDPLAWRDGTVTFLGDKMQRGIVAVDPKIIPLRTRLYISGYGYGYAGDTGSAIIGNRVDLGVNNAQEEKNWMHRKVTVYILEKSKTW